MTFCALRVFLNMQELKEAFEQNDPNHSCWNAATQLMLGKDHHSKQTLLQEVSDVQLHRFLFGLSCGITASQWFFESEEDRRWMLLTQMDIKTNAGIDGTLLPLVQEKWGIARSCWQETSDARKYSVWSEWGFGIGVPRNRQGPDLVGLTVLKECMDNWKPLDAQGRQWKIRALLTTLQMVGEDPLHVGVRDGCIEHYGGRLTQALKNEHGQWTLSTGSIQLWHMLEQFPHFHDALGYQHPWMLSLAAAYAHDTKAAQQTYYQLDPNNEAFIGSIVVPTFINPLNPMDHLLAQAIFSNRTLSPVVAPKVQGLYMLVEGMPSMLDSVLALPDPNGQAYQTADIHGSLFEHQP